MDENETHEYELLSRLMANPADMGALAGMVDICGSRGDLEGAARYLQKMADLSDDAEFVAAIYLEIGRIMEIRDDYAGAEGYYTKGLAMRPEKRETAYFLHNNLGYCLNILGRPQEALRYCEEAIRISGERHNAFKNSGIALRALGRFVDAGKRFMRATALCPMDRRAFFHLSDMLGRHPDLKEKIPEIENFFDCFRNANGADEINDRPVRGRETLQ